MKPEIMQLMAEREALDKKIKEVTASERSKALEICKEYVKEYGFTAKDLGLKNIKPTRSVAPKYLGPGGETWAGRGRKPTWLQQAELQGKTAENFLIKTDSIESINE